jgi:myosin heavy subunit/ankyrin repeat protein
MEYAFVPSDTAVYSLCKVITQDASANMVQVEILDDDEKTSSSTPVTVKREDLIAIFEADLHHLQGQVTDDLTHLVNVNRASILHILRKRYEQEYIYTSIGSILVAINPFQNIPGLYTNETMTVHQSGELNLSNSPHVYAIAANAKNGLSLGINQSIIVSGESGSGKTESMKHCMNFLTNTSTSNTDQSNAQFAHVPILEAMGNAKTLRNNNSSRFGKYTEILFSENHSSIVNSNLSTYLLEKTRVVSQETDERNYHIFYFLLNGGSQDMLKQLDLLEYQQNPALCYYLGQSGCVSIESMNDKECFDELEGAFRDLYFNNHEKMDLYTTLAGVLHMGNIAAVNDPINEGECIIPNVNKTHIERCAKAWGLEAFGEIDSLESVLLKRSVRRGGKNASIAFRKYTAGESSQARDAIAKEVYKRFFDWVVNRINELIKTQHHGSEKEDSGVLSIGMLDIFGFEICAKNSFEQLCINLCNEVMQMHFNKSIFDLEMEIYKNENILLPPLTYNNNEDVIDLLRNKSNGCFTILDDEINVPGGSFSGYMNKLDTQHKNNVRYKSMKKGKDVGFIITHYAGQVNYDPSLFLEKNKDTLPVDAVELLQGSSMALIRDLFSEAPEKSKASNKKSVSKIFLQQLDDLVLTLSQTKSHFIRCIKPNAEKTPFIFDALSIDDQLRNSGVFETVLVMKNGYSFRLEHSLFINMYHSLMLSDNIEHQLAWKALLSDSSKNYKQKCESFISGMRENDMSGSQSVAECKVGTTLVFFRPKQYYELDKLRTQKVHKSACLLQKVAVTYMTRLLMRGIRERIRVCEAAFLNTEFDSLHTSSSHVRSYLERLQRFPPTMLAVAVVASAVEVLKISDQFLIVYDKVQQLGSEVTKILPLFSADNEATFQDKIEGLQSLFKLFVDIDDMNFRGVYKESLVEYEWSQFPILQEAHTFVTRYDEQYTLYNSFVEAQKGNDHSTMQECTNSLEILRKNGTVENMFLQPFVDVEGKVSKILQPLKEERDALIQQCLASLQLSEGESSIETDNSSGTQLKLKDAKHISTLISELKSRKTMNKNIHVTDIINCFEKVLSLREMATASQWSSLALQLSEWRDVMTLKKDKRRRRSSLNAPSGKCGSSTISNTGNISTTSSFTVPFELEDALNKEVQVLSKCTALYEIKPKLSTAIASHYIPGDYFMTIQEKEDDKSGESERAIITIDALEIVIQEAEDYRPYFDETSLILYMIGQEHLSLLQSVQSTHVSSIEQCLRQSTMMERSHKDYIQAETVARSLEMVSEMHAIVNIYHHSGAAGQYKCTVTSYYLTRFKQCIINAEKLSISNEKWQLLLTQFGQLHDMYTFLLNDKDDLALTIVRKFFSTVPKTGTRSNLRRKEENKMSNADLMESMTGQTEQRAVVHDVYTLIVDHFTTWQQELTHRQAVSDMLDEISSSSMLTSQSNSTLSSLSSLSSVAAMDKLYNKYVTKFISGEYIDKIRRDMRELVSVRAAFVSQDTTTTPYVQHDWGQPCINPDNTLNKFPTPQPDNEHSLAASKDEVDKLRGLSMEVLRAVDVHQNTLLIWAADKGAVATVEFLLEKDSSNVNHRGYLGNTALGRAARGGHVQCVELLLKCEAIDCNIPNDKKQFPLHFASFKLKPDCVRVMMDSGKFDYTVKDRKGRIPAQDTSDESIRTVLLKARATQVREERAKMKNNDDIPIDMNPVLRSEYEIVLHKVMDQKIIAAMNELLSQGTITSAQNSTAKKEKISINELAESIQFYEKYQKVSIEAKFLLLNAKMIYYLRQCVLLDRWEEEKVSSSNNNGNSGDNSTSDTALDMALDLSFLNLSTEELMKHLQSNSINRHISLVTAEGDVLPLSAEEMNKNLAIFAYLEETSDLSRLSISDTTIMNLLNDDLVVLDTSESIEEGGEGGRGEKEEGGRTVPTASSTSTDLSSLTVSRLLRIFSSTGIHSVVSQEVSAVRGLSIDRRARLLLHHAALDGNLHGTLEKGLEIENVRTSLLIHALAFVDKYSVYCTSSVVQNWTRNAKFLLNMRINLLTLSDTYSEHKKGQNDNNENGNGKKEEKVDSSTKIVSTRRLSQFLPRMEHLAESEVSIFDTLIRTSFQVADFETILEGIVDGFPSYEITFVRNTLQNLLSIDNILMSLSIGRPVVTRGRFDVSTIKYEHLNSLLEHFAGTNTDTTTSTTVSSIADSTTIESNTASIAPTAGNVSQKVATLLTYAQLIMQIRQAIHLRLNSEESLALETLHTSLINLENKMNSDKENGLEAILPAVVAEEYAAVELDYRRQVIICEYRRQFASNTVHGAPLSLTLSHADHTLLEQQQAEIDALDVEGNDDELQQIKVAAAQMVSLRQTAMTLQSSYNRDNSLALALSEMNAKDLSLRSVTSKIVDTGYLEEAIQSALKGVSTIRDDVNQLRAIPLSNSNTDDDNNDGSGDNDTNNIMMDLDTLDNLSLKPKKEWQPIMLSLAGCLQASECTYSKDELDVLLEETRHRSYMNAVVKYLVVLDCMDTTLQGRYDTKSHKLQAAAVVNRLSSTVKAAHRSMGETRVGTPNHKESLFVYLRKSTVIAIHLYRALLSNHFDTIHRDWRSEDVNFTSHLDSPLYSMMTTIATTQYNNCCDPSLRHKGIFTL